MTAPLKLSLVIDGDATGLKRAVGETNAAITSIGPVSATAGRAAGEMGKQAAAGTALARHEVSNLSAQLADLGVQIAGGGSPFLAMIQQGPQIADVLGGRGLTGIIAGVGQGLMSLVNPVTLFLAGITAAGYAASALFDAISGGAGEANLSLEEQEALVGRVGKKFRDELPAVAEFNKALERKRDLADQKAAIQVVVEDQYEEARETYRGVQPKIADALLNAQGAGVKPEQIIAISESFRILSERIDASTASGEEARAVQQRLAQTGIPLFIEYARAVGTVADALDKASANAQPARDQLANTGEAATTAADRIAGLTRNLDQYRQVMEHLTGTAKPVRSPLDQIEADVARARALAGSKEDRDAASEAAAAARRRVADQQDAAGKPTPTPRPNDIERLDDEAAATAKVASRTELLLASQRDRLELLRAEVGAVGQSEEARRALIAGLETEQKIRSLGIPLYGEEANAMRANSAEIVRLTQERADGVKRARDAEKEWSADRNTAKGILGDFAGVLRDGASGWEAWAAAGERALDRILDRLADSAIDSLLDAWLPKPGASPSSGSAPFASTIGNIGQLFTGEAGQFSASALADRLQGKPRGGVTIPYAVIDGQNYIGGKPAGSAEGLFSSGALADRLNGSFNAVGNYRSGVDARLTDILQTAAAQSGMKVDAFSGFRAGDSRFHGKGLATDIRLFDAAGKALPNYQDAGSFRAYEQFAQTARSVQMEKYPELAQDFRWGGYFGGPKGKDGAVDTMHFDLGGRRVGMGGGSWEGGLNAGQRALWPGAESAGMAEQVKSTTKALEGLATGGKAAADASLDAAQGFAGAAGGMGKLAQQLMSVGGGAGGGGWFSSLMGLTGGAGGAINWMNAISPTVTAAIAGGAVGLFADGGWTGPGAKHQAKGIVHADEIVWSKADVARHGGVEVVEAMRLGARGYAEGGVVSAMPFSIPRMEAAAGAGAGAMGGLRVSVGVSVDKNGNLEAYVTGIAQEKSDAAAKREVKNYSAGSFGRHMQNDAQARQRVPGHATPWR